MEPKKKQHPVVHVTGDANKVRCCEEQYCIGTSMLGPRIKVNWKWSNRRWQENIDVLEISELKWTGISDFKADDHYIYYCGEESLRKNIVANIVNKRVWKAVLGRNLKNDRMISVHFQCKPFNITIIQVYALTGNAEEAEVEQFYEDLQELLELTPKRVSLSL